MNSDYEKLFLIEIFVDSVNVLSDILNLDPSIKSSLGGTCVTIQFLDNPPLVVCEEDFIKRQSTRTSSINFSQGKSCLFSVRASVCQNTPVTLDVVVSVLKKILSPEGNEHVSVGSVAIPMGDSFTSLIRSSEVNKSNLPATKTKSGNYALLDSTSNQIGNISVFLRLSSLGPMIVTQIQYSGDTYLFKGTDSDKVYEYPGDESKKPVPVEDQSKPPFSQTLHESYPSPKGDPSAIQPPQILGKPQAYPSDQDIQQPYPEEMACVQRYDDGYPSPSQELMYDFPSCATPSVSTDKRGSYKEIIAEIRGHALKIRVPRKPKKKFYSDDEIGPSNGQQLEILQGVSRPESKQCQCACMQLK